MKTLSVSVGRTTLTVVLVVWAVSTSTIAALTAIALPPRGTATTGGRPPRTSTTTPTTLWGTASSSAAAVAAVGTNLGLRFPPIVPFGKHAPVFALPEDEDGQAADTAKHILGGKGANLAEMSQLSLRYVSVMVVVGKANGNQQTIFHINVINRCPPFTQIFYNSLIMCLCVLCFFFFLPQCPPRLYHHNRML